MRVRSLSIFAFLILGLWSCSSSRPYSCGPVLDQPTIERTFRPILEFMDIRAGETFADVGASTGYYTIMMSTLLEGTTIYVQDIDSACLNRREFDKVVEYYSRQSKLDLRKRNELKFTLGSSQHTNLPAGYFDHIYSNGTFHHFENPDSILQDLYTKLKPDGDFTVRDSFATTDDQYCGDRNSTKLLRKEVFLQIMERNGFVLIDKKDFAPYPAYRFRKN